jgi:4-hydroxy-2-oxoheptanedioate aldolase
MGLPLVVQGSVRATGRSVANGHAASLPTRLNAAIAALDSGKPAFGFFLQAGSIPDAIWGAASDYDCVVFEMEHNALDLAGLRLSLQFMLDRRQILETATAAPHVAPFVRIPANGREQCQWLVKQVLDIGVYGIVFPMINTPEDAVAALQAMRYGQAMGAPDQHPVGQRGHSPTLAARYWGLSTLEYTDRADVWPLDPQGELLPCLQCETIEAVHNLPRILDAVQDAPGVILISERDLSVSMGHRSLTTPEVEAAVQQAIDTCRRRGVPYGSPQVTPENVAQRLADGFTFLMPVALPFGAKDTRALEVGRRLAGRTGED